MKLIVLQEKLAKATTTASRFVSSKAQLPVLGNLHLKTKKNKLLINATNLEISISLSLGAQVGQEGEITVPAKQLTEIINNLPDKPIELEVVKEQLKISTENFSSVLAGVNASDFPKIPASLGKEVSELPIDLLVQALNKTLFSISVDDTRPHITGALLLFKTGRIEVISTDGFRLSQKKIPLKGLKQDLKVIIPKTVLSEVSRLSNDSEPVLFEYNQNESQVIFGLPGIILSSRVIEGEFPPYEKIIPKENGYKLSVDKEEFARTVRLASVFAKESLNAIKFNLKKNGLDILAESKSTGNQKSYLEAKCEGELPKDSEIAFNFRFLEDVVSVIDGDFIDMSFLGSDAAGVFKDPRDIDYLHLIMPIKIKS